MSEGRPANRELLAAQFVDVHLAETLEARGTDASIDRVGLSAFADAVVHDSRAMKVLFSSPGLEDLWQMHFSLLSGQEYTVPGAFIANTVDEQPATMPIEAVAPPAPGPGAPPPAHDGAAYWIKIAALRDGTFTVTNARNGFAK